ncbi:hypothetical protein FN846DRAFT_888988 [Sphaerosporella brunnea]|uniref:Uncharacterized protein n=1 Tax=Sphaerosporella brunnea TaxID=1250544 RepID=A0A5J5F0N1_9PEZI|nr:hypothetical protein FN846DRAFT_888988 [Sphaerosporella brunnea]
MAVRSSTAGYTFAALRIFQILALLSIFPLLLIFMARIDSIDAVPPYQLLYTLILSIFAMLYIVPTAGLHLCGTPSYTALAVFDAVFSGLFIAASIFLGLPLSRISCREVARLNYNIETLEDVTFPSNSSDIYRAENFGEVKLGHLMLPELGSTYAQMLESAGKFEQWVGRVAGVCRQMKGAWAGCLLLVVLCAGSAVAAVLLRRKVWKIPEFEDEEEKTILEDEAVRMRGGEESERGLLRESIEGIGPCEALVINHEL